MDDEEYEKERQKANDFIDCDNDDLGYIDRGQELYEDYCEQDSEEEYNEMKGTSKNLELEKKRELKKKNEIKMMQDSGNNIKVFSVFT